MPIIAVINRKGGSGKSTLATNIAGWCATRGWQVMIGDVDRQQSIKSWLSRRKSNAPIVLTWVVDHGKVFRAPRGTTHAVLDTPGALYDYALTKIVVSVDAVVVPVGPSIFDHDASIACLQELQKHPRIASGRCKLIAVGMRWPQDRINAWHAAGKQWEVALLTIIPEDPIYRECLEEGASIFDVDAARISRQMIYWQPLLGWLSNFWAGEQSPALQIANHRGMGVSNSCKNLHIEDSPKNGATHNTLPAAAKGAQTQLPADRVLPIPAYLLNDSGVTPVTEQLTVAGQDFNQTNSAVPGLTTDHTPSGHQLGISDAPLSLTPSNGYRSWISRLLQIK
jgi:chromosome partitioning protein